MKTAVIWFTQDLRIADNPTLQAASSADQLVCIYCVDPSWFRPSAQQAKPVGKMRWRFIWESITALGKSLALQGHKLHVLSGPPQQIVSEVLAETAASDLYLSRRFGLNENRQLEQIKQQHSNLNIHEIDSYTLFDHHSIMPLLNTLPSSFSAFRRQAEKVKISTPCDFSALPPSLAYQHRSPFKLEKLINTKHLDFKGGETKADQHLSNYFSSTLPKHYKDSRNHIDDWQSSTKFSAWLNQGCISPRQIVIALKDYETKHGKNPGTEWIFVELLWREFFQWLALQIGKDLYTFKGLSTSQPLTSFYPERFKAWTEGKTPWPLVNACMRQLKETGYLSNRGRQIAASALVNELCVDWRYGAAWFEEQLIDYDVASNWGNWQYIAGVGVDSRGGRHFNIEKQTEIYDPDGSFQKRWAGSEAYTQIDHQDPTGWPISIS